MITNTIEHQSAQSLILVPVEADAIGQLVSSTEESYFAGLLDTGDETVAQIAAALSPIAHAATAPTAAAYFIGLLDYGDE